MDSRLREHCRLACALALVAMVLAIPACGSVDSPLSITGDFLWSITKEALCPVPDGLLTALDSLANEPFTINQTGNSWSASFTDSAGNSVSMNGTYSDGHLRGSFTIIDGGRTISGTIEGRAARHDDGMIELDGSVVVQADTQQICDGGFVDFWAMTGTPPAQTIEQCPAVDIVFIMDTSGSMEDEAAALCAGISSVESDLRALGLDEIRSTLLGITETVSITETGATPTPEFACLTNTVYRLMGGDGVNHPVVPGNPPAATTFQRGPDRFQSVDPTVLDPFDDEAEEFWAPATALIAARFDWLPDATGAPTVRVIVPISDESPQSGRSTCFSVDEAAIANAIAVAKANGVIVSPIIGTLSDQDQCIRDLAADLARETGGLFSHSTDPTNDLAQTVFEIVEAACTQVPTPRPPPEPTPEETLRVCPPVDLVFVMDTSGSMDDEAAALCEQVSGVRQRLIELGLSDIRTTLLGITADGDQLAEAGRPDFACLTDSVQNLLGPAVPGDPLPDEAELNDSEDWAPGATVVAARFPWTRDALRIVVTISDEGPENGGLNDPGDCEQEFDEHQAAIDNAISVARANDVIVSPIIAFDSDQQDCLEPFATQLAEATGGTVSRSTDPGADFAQTIFDIVLDACENIPINAER